MVRTYKGGGNPNEKTPLRSHWDEVKADRLATEKAGLVEAFLSKGRMTVIAPFKEGFPSEARKIAGRWKTRSRRWIFPASNHAQRAALADLIVRFHGDEQLPDILRGDRI